MNTSAFIEVLVQYMNTVKPGFKVYYDRAPKDKAFPYGVISYVTASSLDEGDLTSFDLELWTDDKLPSLPLSLKACAISAGKRSIIRFCRSKACSLLISDMRAGTRQTTGRTISRIGGRSMRQEFFT